MIHNRSVPTNTVLPHVTYVDVTAAASWLGTTLGFEEHLRYGEPIAGMQLHMGDAWIMIESVRPDKASPAQVGKMTQSLTIVVEDVDQRFDHATAVGARIVEDLNETVYGERQFVVVDPEGHHWLIAQHIRDVAPEAWGATSVTG